jgi:hypothetical protein
MFYYVFPITGSWATVRDADDIRIVDSRAEALMYIKILGLPVRVVSRPA